MKKSPLPNILLGLLTLSALASVVLCWMYITAARELRILNAQAAMVQNNRMTVNALIADAVEYSKKNPAIDPLLEAAQIKQPRSGAAPATNLAPPAAKPPAK